MNRVRSAVLLVVYAAAALWAAPVVAQEPPAPTTITEREAVDRAVRENLSLRSRRTSLSATERQTETAWNVLLPSVSANAALSRSNEEQLSRTAPLSDPYYAFGSFSLSAQLTLAASIVKEVEAARHDLAAERLSYEQAKANVAKQVRTLFYSIVLAEQRIAVREAAVESSEQNLAQVRASYEDGRVAQRTVRQAELSVAQSRLQLRRSRATLEDSLANFKGLLGIAQDQALELSGSLPVDAGSAADELPKLEAGSRPDVAQLASQIESRKARLKAAKMNRWLPTLSVSASYEPAIAGYQGIPDPFNPDNPPNKDSWADNGRLSLTLSFGLDRLLPFSSEAVSVQSARKRAAALRLDRQAAVESAQREYESLRRAVENARAAVESQRLNVSLNEEVVALTAEAYEAGQSDFSSLQEAQVSLAEARLALLNEAYNLQSSLIELEYAAGGQLMEQ